MTITKPAAPAKPRDVDAFIDSAPDASAKPALKPAKKHTMKGNQTQISLAMPPELLENLDAFVAANPGLKRGPAINIAIRQMLEQGIVVNLRPAGEAP